MPVLTGILYKNCSFRIGCSVLSILTQFLPLHVMVDGRWSILVNVVRSVALQCLGRVIVPIVHIGTFFILENKLIGYADDSTLMASVASPGVRITVAESLIRDFGRVNEWCDLCGIKLNASETNTIIVSGSRNKSLLGSLNFRTTYTNFINYL